MSDYKPTPYSPSRPSNGNQARKRNHPFIVSGIFDISVKVEPDGSGQYGSCTCQTTISTLNDESPDIVEWVINATAYVGPDNQLEAGNCYYLKGRLLAFNTQATQSFYFEPDHHVFVNTSDGLPGGLANTVSVTGVGLILSRSVETVSPGKDNVTIVVKHSDYNPLNRAQESFEVQYRCNWSKLMEKLQILLVPTRKVAITGNITGWIPSSHTWVVNITGVNIMTGPENNYNSSGPLPTPSLTTPGGRSRGKIAFTGNSTNGIEPHAQPIDGPQDSSQPSSPSKGKGKAPARPRTSPLKAAQPSPVASSSKTKTSIASKAKPTRSPAKRMRVVPEEINDDADKEECDELDMM
ncbi:uncharacterized protein MELLADRAFT_104579 [Melampsora larici-populina 98AG31]|uniref:Uncharacterized protein n=1 Tax=Melampsora larici-populina (strain 98AG31 / pathotype 3-4-7) TaxID=747676 RepID=F4RF72_MELLP|nr:uncharacterized protein MELLADRAFT_104579 [Melampsora larici-populina 98AG31]EGG08984.1 hypothetical protein MELLADRAFT_104579 [Melampsora larici-populina 98AG31]